MKNIVFVLYSFLVCKTSFANKYSELQVDPSVLSGASGSDDYILALMFPFIFIGSVVVAQLFKSDFYTPVKEVIIFIVVSIGLMYLWAVNN
jgi:hypothetical protein